jgi:phage gpG-like protein
LAKSEHINKKNKQTLASLVRLMKDIDQKYSIKVGIIGEKAQEQHSDSGLTNAELGAIHEFGCTINVTDKMRAYLHHIGIHLRPDTTTIVIPTRSFLRMPLLSDEFKNHLMTDNGIIQIFEAKDFSGKGRKQEAREMNIELAEMVMDKNATFMESLAQWIAIESLRRVRDAFNTGGLGKWAPISEVTKQNRTKDKSSPPLTDTGQLRDSITAEVKKVK